MGGNLSSANGELADFHTKKKQKSLCVPNVSRKQWEAQSEVVKRTTKQSVGMEINVGKLPSMVFVKTNKKVDKIVGVKFNGLQDETKSN